MLRKIWEWLRKRKLKQQNKREMKDMISKYNLKKKTLIN